MAKTKPFETKAEEIIKLSNSKKDNVLSELYARMDRHFDLLSLKEYQPEEEGYSAYTSPRPKNDFDKVGDALDRAPLTFAIKLPSDSPEKKRNAASKGEQYLAGALNEADRIRLISGETRLREALSFHARARGWISIACLIHRKGDDAVHDIRPIDVRSLQWEMGDDGPLWVTWKETITKGAAASKYGNKVAGDVRDDEMAQPTYVVNWIDRVNHGVILESTKKWIKKLEPHLLDHVPVYINSIGSMPSIHSEKGSTLKYRGDTVFTSSEKVYPFENKYISMHLDILEKSRTNTLVTETEDGKVPFDDGDPYKKGGVVPLKTGEKIYTLPLPEVSESSGIVGKKLEQDKQESSVPSPSGYGLDPEGHSSLALNSMTDAMRSNFSKYTAGIADAYKWLAEEMFTQYEKKSPSGGKTFAGFTNPDDPTTFFNETIKPDDIDPGWFVQINYEPRLPRDEYTEINMAIQATAPDQTGVPLMSKRNARENIIKLQNAEAEQNVIDEEFTSALPIVKCIKTVEPFIEKEEMDMALAICMAWPPSDGVPVGDIAIKTLGLDKLLPKPEPQQPQGMMPMGAPMPQGGTPPQIPPELVMQVQQMAAQGMPLEMIAQQLGVPPQIIQMILQGAM